MEFGHEGHKGHEGHEEKARDVAGLERLAKSVVDAGFAVHKALGPGLLEATYEHCLVHELQARGLSCQRQAALPIVYDGMRLDIGYRLDIIVENAIIIEVKAVETLTRLHDAQLLTYLKFSKHKIGFIMNFNVELFKHGLKRFVM